MRHRASISNIAWPSDADDEALTLAGELGFSGIELAPAKIFGPLNAVTSMQLRQYKSKLTARGLATPALQAILFGVSDAHLFQGPEPRRKLFEHLFCVAKVAEVLEAKACVFGSPTLRDPGSLSNENALNIATDFFTELAPRFAAHGTAIAFEANPMIYNCRFVTKTEEAIALVERVGSLGFNLQLDTGTVFANSEEQATLDAAAAIALHFHASEPNLVPIGSGGFDHEMCGRSLRDQHYDGWVSVEMRATDDWQSSIQSAAALIAHAYREN